MIRFLKDNIGLTNLALVLFIIYCVLCSPDKGGFLNWTQFANGILISFVIFVAILIYEEYKL